MYLNIIYPMNICVSCKFKLHSIQSLCCICCSWFYFISPQQHRMSLFRFNDAIFTNLTQWDVWIEINDEFLLIKLSLVLDNKLKLTWYFRMDCKKTFPHVQWEKKAFSAYLAKNKFSSMIVQLFSRLSLTRDIVKLV